jgi:AsmA protein
MKKKPLIIIGVVVVVLILIVLALPMLIDVNKFKPEIETQMSTALGRKVTVGNLRLSILSGGVEVDDLAIADDPAFSHSAFVTAKDVSAGVALLPLIFSGRLGVSSFTIENPQVSLVHNAAGKWNFSTMGGAASGAASKSPGSPAQISVGKLSVKNGTITVSTEGKGGAPGKAHTYENVDLDASDLAFTSAFPFTLSLKTPGGGTVKVDGKAGPINSTDAAATPLTAKIDVKDADLALSGFVDAASGIAGIADVTANVDSNGDSINAAGSVKIEKLKAAANGSPAKVPVSVDYDTTYDVKHDTGSLKRGDIHIGKVTMHLTGNYNTAGATPTLQMKLNGQGMSVPELEGVLPAAGVALPPGATLEAGSLDLNLSITGPADKLTIVGPVNLSNGKIAGYSVKSKMGPLASLMGMGGGGGNDTEIQSLHTDLRQDASGTHAANLNVVIVGVGTVTGDANVSPTGELNCKMVANLSGAGGAVLGAPGKLVGGIGRLAGGGKSQGSGGGIPFTVTGTTANPVIVPNAGAVAGQAATGLVKAPVGAASSVAGGIGGLFGHKKSN